MKNSFYTEKYINEAVNLTDFELNESYVIRCESPSNIALIKYWGKYGQQLPTNPSLSFSLENSKTETKVIITKSKNEEQKLTYYFHGQQNQEFENRIQNYLKKVTEFQPFITKLNFQIHSENTFPHSAGIASSASSFSALAKCLCSIEKKLFQTLQDEKGFNEKASFLARLGSGSAARSFYPGAVLWGKSDLIKNSSNEVAVSVNESIHENFKNYYDAVLIVSSEMKSVSSSEGHALMQNHPFAKARNKQAHVNLEKLLLALKTGGEKLFAEIVENEAMTLHALMMSSNPSINLLAPNTLHIISRLNEFRKKHSLDFTYTLDAGPNIHILYPYKTRNKIKQFIENELLKYCENKMWIDDKISMRFEPKIILENEI